MGAQETSRMASADCHHLCVQHSDRICPQYDSGCPGKLSFLFQLHILTFSVNSSFYSSSNNRVRSWRILIYSLCGRGMRLYTWGAWRTTADITSQGWPVRRSTTITTWWTMPVSVDLLSWTGSTERIRASGLTWRGRNWRSNKRMNEITKFVSFKAC